MTNQEVAFDQVLVNTRWRPCARLQKYGVSIKSQSATIQTGNEIWVTELKSSVESPIQHQQADADGNKADVGSIQLCYRLQINVGIE